MDLAGDSLMKRFYVSKACLLLPKYKRFIGSNVDLSCTKEAMLKLVLIYAWQMLRNNESTDSGGQLWSSGEVRLKAVEAIVSKSRLPVRKVLDGYPPMHTFPLHILYHLSTYFGMAERSKMARSSSTEGV